MMKHHRYVCGFLHCSIVKKTNSNLFLSGIKTQGVAAASFLNGFKNLTQNLSIHSDPNLEIFVFDKKIELKVQPYLYHVRIIKH